MKWRSEKEKELTDYDYEYVCGQQKKEKSNKEVVSNEYEIAARFVRPAAKTYGM